MYLLAYLLIKQGVNYPRQLIKPYVDVTGLLGATRCWNVRDPYRLGVMEKRRKGKIGKVNMVAYVFWPPNAAGAFGEDMGSVSKIHCLQ